jgi:membrane protein DedA with SNARE-associated domain
MSGISGVVEHFPYFGIFLLLILGGIGLPIPEDTTLILCGFLVTNGVIRPLPAFLVVYSGLLITDFSLYYIGKKYGRRIVTHKKFYKIISAERLLKIEDKFRKWGVLIILLGRHVIGMRAQLLLVSGVMRMAPLKFLLADAVSAIFTIALWGGIGFIGGNSLQIIRKDITRIEHLAILLIVIFISIYLLFKYFRMSQGKTYL